MKVSNSQDYTKKKLHHHFNLFIKILLLSLFYFIKIPLSITPQLFYTPNKEFHQKNKPAIIQF
jgi:hypothetical protein